MAEAPESRAAWIVGGVLAKVTFLGVVMRSAFPVFKIDRRDGAVDLVRDEVDELAVE